MVSKTELPTKGLDTFQGVDQCVLCGLITYLRLNPTACDTEVGIQKWWFSQAQQVGLGELALALEFLVSKGILVAKKGVDNRVRYSRQAINADSDAEMARLAQSICGRVSGVDEE